MNEQHQPSLSPSTRQHHFGMQMLMRRDDCDTRIRALKPPAACQQFCDVQPRHGSGFPNPLGIQSGQKCLRLCGRNPPITNHRHVQNKLDRAVIFVEIITGVGAFDAVYAGRRGKTRTAYQPRHIKRYRPDHDCPCANITDSADATSCSSAALL